MKDKQIKYCPKCQSDLDIKFFHKNKARFDGLESACAECLNKQRRERRKTEPLEKTEKRRERSKAYNATHKEQLSIRSKINYQNNKEKIQERHKKYSKDNSEKRRINERNLRHTNPTFKLRKDISKDVGRALSKRNLSKNGESTFKHLSYTPLQLKEHLESLFESWMTWQNRGPYDPSTWDDNNPKTWTWQIDHIIPHCNFLYTNLEDPLFQECWALSNLRPYSAKQNIIDGSRGKPRKHKGHKRQ